MIDITELTDDDHGKWVIYTPPDRHSMPEPGVISSWNEDFIFVLYLTGDTAAATRPHDLEWDGIAEAARHE